MTNYHADAVRLRNELDAYRSRFPDEATSVGRFFDLLSHGEPTFHRHHVPGHFTASAIVLDPQLRRVLLTHHRKLNIRIQLGAHTDGQADLLAAVLPLRRGHWCRIC